MWDFADELKLEKGSFFSLAGNHIEKCGFEEGEYIKPGFYKDEYGVVMVENITGPASHHSFVGSS